MIRRFTMSATALLLCIAAPSAAQEAIDPAAVEAARTLLQAADFEAQMVTATEQITAATVTTLMQQFEQEHGTAFPAEVEAEFRQILRDHNAVTLAEVLPHALEDAAQIYARYFSAQEIAELQRLQTHPVMMKLQRIAPQFMAELSQIGAAAAVRRLPEVQQRIREAVEAWLVRNARHNETPPDVSMFSLGSSRFWQFATESRTARFPNGRGVRP